MTGILVTLSGNGQIPWKLTVLDGQSTLTDLPDDALACWAVEGLVAGAAYAAVVAHLNGMPDVRGTRVHLILGSLKGKR